MSPFVLKIIKKTSNVATFKDKIGQENGHSVTGFGEISPLWYTIKKLAIFAGFIRYLAKCLDDLANFKSHLANFKSHWQIFIAVNDQKLCK